MNNDLNNNIALSLLNTIANITQLESYKLLQQDLNNSDLMKELQHQDKEYLEKIINQNDEIIKLLKEGGKDGRKT